jgi:dTDP-4-dehydrorhamnose 3,5-epimerase
MNLIPTDIPGAVIIEPKVWGDERGFFLETYRANRYAELGIRAPLVQDNLSYSRRGVLRGLHCQHPGAQGKLVQVFAGEVFDVAVDLRQSSPTFGKWVGEIISSENKKQMWIPEGFAHGFLTLSDTAEFLYKSTDFYSPEHERSIIWNDPNINIVWPLEQVFLSNKDSKALFLEI